jgi:hypothetical protein
VASWSSFARRARVPLGFAFAVLYVWLAKPTAASMLAGGALAIPGLLLRALASGYVQKNEQLATSGPYAHTRNPLYLGSLILAAGFALAARSWWVGIAIVVFFLVIYVPVIRDRLPSTRATAISPGICTASTANTIRCWAQSPSRRYWQRSYGSIADKENVARTLLSAAFRVGERVVGIRHYVRGGHCTCRVCTDH